MREISIEWEQPFRGEGSTAVKRTKKILVKFKNFGANGPTVES